MRITPSSQQRADVRRERNRMSHRVGQREAELGQVEVLHAERSLVAVRVEGGEHGGEVDVATVGGMHLYLATPGLAQLHVTGPRQQLAGILAPTGDVAGV